MALNVRCVLFACLLVSPALSVFAQTPPACPLGNGWEFVPEFSDEFNGNALDGEKWWDFNPMWVGRRPGYFARENVAVKNGTLQLTARSQDPEKVTVENKVRGFNLFTTAAVKSKKRVRYGYFEARCKSMKASVCNAFWLYDPLDPPAKYREGSYSEEIDIFEVFGKPTKKGAERILFTTVHRFETPYVEATVKLRNKSTGSKWKAPFNFCDDFHVYAFLWTPEKMKWFIDGQEVFALENEHYHTALHINFDSEIMQGWVGLPDPADLPATFHIDYVRHWRQKEPE